MSITTQGPEALPGTAADAIRQVVVAGSAVVALIGLLVGLGRFGGPETRDAAGGVLTSATTLIAPGQTAFTIWTPIYLGLLGLGIWQLVPNRRADPRQRRAGWWIAVTMLANTAWLLVVQRSWIWASVAIIALLLLALSVTAARLSLDAPASRIEAMLVDGTMGLYLGWVCVAAIANVAAALVVAGTPAIGTGPVVVTVALLGMAAAIGWYVTGVGAGRWAFCGALAWGLAWIAVARIQGPTHSPAVAVAAGVAAVAVALAPPVLRPQTPGT